MYQQSGCVTINYVLTDTHVTETAFNEFRLPKYQAQILYRNQYELKSFTIFIKI